MYAFVHIEKTAGSTLNTIFRRSLGTRHCDIRLRLAKRRDEPLWGRFLRNYVYMPPLHCHLA